MTTRPGRHAERAGGAGEREIATMLHVAQDARRPIEQRAETVRAASRRIDALYQRELDALARRHGKQGAEQRVVVAAPGYHVVLRTEPAGGAIAHMPQGFWELAAFLRKNGQPDYPDPPWEHVADPDFVLLGGRNLFQVTWPGRKPQQFPGVRIRSKATITFTPTQIREIVHRLSRCRVDLGLCGRSAEPPRALRHLAAGQRVAGVPVGRLGGPSHPEDGRGRTIARAGRDEIGQPAARCLTTRPGPHAEPARRRR